MLDANHLLPIKLEILSRHLQLSHKTLSSVPSFDMYRCLLVSTPKPRIEPLTLRGLKIVEAYYVASKNTLRFSHIPPKIYYFSINSIIATWMVIFLIFNIVGQRIIAFDRFNGKMGIGGIIPRFVKNVIDCFFYFYLHFL